MTLQSAKKHAIRSVVICLLMGIQSACSETMAPDTKKEPEIISRQISAKILSESLNKDKETRIETVDMLVFIRDTDGKLSYSFLSTANPEIGTDGEILPLTHTVKMESGSTIAVHVFTNVHQELVEKELFLENLPADDAEKKIETLLHAELKGLNNPDTPLPMYGRYKGALKTHSLTVAIEIIRCVAKVGVQLGDEITNFKLRELYAFYPATEGKVVPDEATMNLIAPGKYTITQPSFPPNFTGGSVADSIAIIHGVAVSSIESLYLYENKVWLADGVDNSTTRVVVGGVLNDSSRVTYFLVKNMNNTFSAFIRNHQYRINIVRVLGSGFATPREAANSPLTGDNSLEINTITTADWYDGVMNDGDIEIN